MYNAYRNNIYILESVVTVVTIVTIVTIFD